MKSPIRSGMALAVALGVVALIPVVAGESQGDRVLVTKPSDNRPSSAKNGATASACFGRGPAYASNTGMFADADEATTP